MKNNCLRIFWNNRKFFGIFLVLKLIVFLIKIMISVKWIFIFKRRMWVILVREFFFKNFLLRVIIILSFIKKVLKLLFY